MIRPLFTFVAGLSLVVCVFLMVAGAVYTPGQFRGIFFDDGAWGLSFGNGIVSPFHGNRILASLPIGALAVPFAVPPLAWTLWYYRRDRLRRRVAEGRCVTCGYALTRNVSGRCPECGEPVRSTPPSRAANDRR